MLFLNKKVCLLVLLSLTAHLYSVNSSSCESRIRSGAASIITVIIFAYAWISSICFPPGVYFYCHTPYPKDILTAVLSERAVSCRLHTFSIMVSIYRSWTIMCNTINSVDVSTELSNNIYQDLLWSL